MPLALGEWETSHNGHRTVVTGVPPLQLRGTRRVIEELGCTRIKVDAAQRAEIEALVREAVVLLKIPPLLEPLVKIVGPFPSHHPEAGATVKGSGSVLRGICVAQCDAFTPKWRVYFSLLTGVDY